MHHPRVTSREVADRAGVSRTTVSFVLNGVRTERISEETRLRVLQAARELGYVPDAAARTLVSGKTGTLGLVVSRAEHIRVDAFIPQTLHVLSNVCAAHGYRLLIETAEEGQATYDYDQLVGENRVDGLVVLNPAPDDARLRVLIDRHYPIALIGAYPHPDVASVSVDTAAAMDQMTMHLLAKGHERLGFIHYREMHDLDEGGRFRGFRTALERANLPLREEWVRSGNYSASSGYDAMRDLLRLPDTPTAIVTGNDTIAVGAIAAATELGKRIPEDMAIVGFDDIPLARYISPSLTTVRMPVDEMARICGTMLIHLVQQGKLAHRKRVLQAELILRQSCGDHLIR